MRHYRGEGLGESDDNELVEASRQGRGAAFDELFRRHAPMAWRLALAITSDPDDGAEAVANAFCRVLVGPAPAELDPAPDPSRIRPVLLAATRMAAVEALRRGAADARISRVPGSSGRSPVHTSFASLPERWRSALWLTEVEGIPAAEAAFVLAVSPSSFSQLSGRARAGWRERCAHAQATVASADGARIDARCQAVVERLPAYSAGQLGARDAARVERHLDTCEGCQYRSEELSDGGAVLRRTGIALPIGLLADTSTRWKLATGMARHPSSPGRRLPAVLGKPLASTSGALLAVGIIALAVLAHPPAAPIFPAVHQSTATSAPGPSTSLPFSVVVPGSSPRLPSPGGGAGQTQSGRPRPATASPASSGATAPVASVPTPVLSAAATTGPATTTAPATSGPANSGPANSGPANAGASSPSSSGPPLQVALKANVAQVPVVANVGQCTGVNLAGITLGCPSAPAAGAPAPLVAAKLQVSAPLLGSTTISLP